MNRQTQQSIRRLLVPLIIIACSFVFYAPARAQQKPPKPISVKVYIMQSLEFGSFCVGADGAKTITVDTYGNRTTAGNVYLLGSGASAALFIVTALPGTFIHIDTGTPAELTGPGGAILTLTLGTPYPASPFVAMGEYTGVNIGGALSFSTAPAGPYSGFFSVIFMQE